jgi:hypothetical protein
VEFADGVVIAADSKTSMGTWVANRVTDKLTPVTDTIFVCRSGSAADTQVGILLLFFWEFLIFVYFLNILSYLKQFNSFSMIKTNFYA